VRGLVDGTAGAGRGGVTDGAATGALRGSGFGGRTRGGTATTTAGPALRAGAVAFETEPVTAGGETVAFSGGSGGAFTTGGGDSDGGSIRAGVEGVTMIAGGGKAAVGGGVGRAATADGSGPAGAAAGTLAAAFGRAGSAASSSGTTQSKTRGCESISAEGSSVGFGVLSPGGFPDPLLAVNATSFLGTPAPRRSPEGPVSGSRSPDAQAAL
jgi:hypothetical protein